MNNPFQNLNPYQLLANPLLLSGLAQNQQMNTLLSPEQQQLLPLQLWQMNNQLPNLQQQSQMFYPYLSQNLSTQPNLQSILLLSNLLQQSQLKSQENQQPTNIFQMPPNNPSNQYPLQYQLQEPQQILYINNTNTNANKEPDDSKEDKPKSRKVLFKPTIKRTSSSLEQESLSPEEESNIKSNEASKGKQSNETKIKYYKCSFKDCDKVFPKECNLKDHIRTHTGEKPYKCSFKGCEKSFSQHGNLKKHEKVHIGDKKFVCEYANCGKKFSASYNLKIHSRCHTNDRPYKCSFLNCDRCFFDKGNLKYHEKTLHSAESIAFPYSCEHMGCNAKFKCQKDKLNHHNEMEPDCLTERKELIKLIQKYKILLKGIMRENTIDANENEIIINLKKLYEEIEGKLIDVDYFKQLLGESFEDECHQTDEYKEEEKETDQASSIGKY